MSDKEGAEDIHPRKRRKASIETGLSAHDATEPPSDSRILSKLDLRSAQRSEDDLNPHILKSFNSRQDLWGECGKCMDSIDWSKTSLGPRANWPAVYERGLNVVLSNRFPTIYYLGPEFLFLYNDGYIDLLGGGDKEHPKCFGKPGREALPEAWEDIHRGLSRSLSQTGSSMWSSDELMVLNRSGELIETYWTYSYSVLRDEHEKDIIAIVCPLADTTSSIISSRQLNTLKDITAHASESTTTREACSIVMDAISRNNYDFPFAMIYNVDKDRGKLTLVDSTGVDPLTDSFYAPEYSIPDERGPRTSFDYRFPVQQALYSAAILVSTTGKSMTINLANYPLSPCGMWNKPPRHAHIMAITSPGQELPAPVMIMGLNQYRRLDDGYRTFLNLVASQIATLLSNTKAREEEKACVEALAELDRVKTAFFSNISHEFRTPLTLMLGPLEDFFSTEQGLSQSQREQLTLVYRNALRLLKLVNTLLDFSRIEAGRVQATYEPVNLGQLTEELCNIMRPSCEKAGLRLDVRCDVMDDLYVDTEMWEKIVLNLLSNAFKYTFEGSITVRLQLASDGRSAIFSVEDTGTGIPKADQPHIFQRFCRVHNSHGRTHEGTGIGLALVSELIKLHGGTIRVESQTGKGSKFIAQIPRGSSHLPQEQINVHKSEKDDTVDIRRTNYTKTAAWWLPTVELGTDYSTHVTHEEPTTPSHGEAKYKILLVDDNADMREYIYHLICDQYKVKMVGDGQQALEAMKGSYRPDLILSDVMMPRLDGLGLLKAIRMNPNLALIPLIFLSARAGEEFKIEGLTMGAADYLIKPFTAIELRARIASHLRISQARLSSNRAEQELRERAEKANMAKDHFLAVLSHEMRTPLAPALLLAEELKNDDTLSKKTRDEVTMIHRNIQLEVQLIDDLLDVTKVTKGKMVLHPKVIEVNDLIAQTLQILAYDISKKDLHIVTSMDAAHHTVNADPARLQQIFWNIIKNAIKFTPNKGTITISSLNSDDKISVRVTDSGIGITPEGLSKIFTPFEQGGRDITQQFGGLGLGLSISRALAVLHHGELSADSPGLGKGATFSLTIPYVNDATPRLSEDTPEKDLKRPAPRNILLVEDNETTMMVLRRLLTKKFGHNLRVAYSFSEAIAVAKTYKFDMLISDIGLPDRSGYELIVELHRTYTHQFKSIALTGYGMEEDVQRSLSQGFDLHLTKPVQTVDLGNAIDELARAGDS